MALAGPTDLENVGVRDWLLMTKVMTQPTAGVYTVRFTFETSDEAELSAEGELIVP